ncbi:MAG: helix-turn-helix domain-containing protein [Thiotrichales bacterium]|nr:helix-turn-helix domain-containing protein [Thiotrichales bacterium]
MTTQATLIRHLDAYRARTGVSARRLGLEALNDPGLATTLARGRTLRLASADRLLAFIGAAPLGPRFRHEVETFLRVTRTKRAVFGLEAAGSPSFVARLLSGASPTLATVDRVRAWMRAHANPTERAAIARAVEEAFPTPASERGAPASAPVPRSVLTDSLTHTQGDPSMRDHTTYLDTRAAAAHLDLSPRTLDRYRVSGDGPTYFKLGARVRYRLPDIEAWAAARRRRSTSDDGTGPGAAA